MADSDPDRRSGKGRVTAKKGEVPRLGLGRDTLTTKPTKKPTKPVQRQPNTTPIRPASASAFYHTPNTRTAQTQRHPPSRSGPIDVDSDTGDSLTKTASAKSKARQRDDHDVDDDDLQISSGPSRAPDFDEIPGPKSSVGLAAKMNSKEKQNKPTKKQTKKPAKETRKQPRKALNVDDNDDDDDLDDDAAYDMHEVNPVLVGGYEQDLSLMGDASEHSLQLSKACLSRYEVIHGTQSNYWLYFDKKRLSLCKLHGKDSQILRPWRVFDLKDIAFAQGRIDMTQSVYSFQLKSGSSSEVALADPRTELGLRQKVDDKQLSLGSHLSSGNNIITVVTSKESICNSRRISEALWNTMERVMDAGLREMPKTLFEECMKWANERGKMPNFVAKTAKTIQQSTANKTITIDEDDNDEEDNDDTPKPSKQKRKGAAKGQSDEIEGFSDDDAVQAKKRKGRQSIAAKQNGKEKRPPPQPIQPGQARMLSQSTSKNRDDDDYGSRSKSKAAPAPRPRAARKSKTEAERLNNEAKALTGTPRKPPMDPAVANEVYLVKDFENGSLTIRRGDRASVDPGEYLNDCIVEYGIRSTLMRLRERDPQLADQVHLFSSFFYTSLVNAYEGYGDPYKIMWRWTKSVDIFAKKFILVPICENLHWYLAIIYNPKGVLYGPPGESRDKKKPKARPTAGAAASAAAQKRERVAREEARKRNKKAEAAKKKTHDVVELSSDSEEEQNKGETGSKAGSSKDGDGKEEGSKEEAHSSTSGAKSPEADKDDDDDIVMTEAPPSTQVEQTPSSQTNIPDSNAVEVVGSVEGEADKEGGDVDVIHEDRSKNARCFIYTLDSLNGGHKAVIDNLSRYLQMEAGGRKNQSVEDYSDPDGKTPKVPRQPNWCDCGVYVVHYIDVFFKDTTKYLHLLYNSHKTRRDHTDPQWEHKAAHTARERLTKVLDEEAAAFEEEEIRKGKRPPKQIASSQGNQNGATSGATNVTTATATATAAAPSATPPNPANDSDAVVAEILKSHSDTSDKPISTDTASAATALSTAPTVTAVAVSNDGSDDSKTIDDSTQHDSTPKVTSSGGLQSIKAAYNDDTSDTTTHDVSTALSNIKVPMLDIEDAMQLSGEASSHSPAKERLERFGVSDDNFKSWDVSTRPHRAWESPQRSRGWNSFALSPDRRKSAPDRQDREGDEFVARRKLSWSYSDTQHPSSSYHTPSIPAASSQPLAADQQLIQKLTAEQSARESTADDHILAHAQTVKLSPSPVANPATLSPVQTQTQTQTQSYTQQPAQPPAVRTAISVTNSPEILPIDIPSSSVDAGSPHYTPRSSRSRSIGSSNGSPGSGAELPKPKKKKTRRLTNERPNDNMSITDFTIKSPLGKSMFSDLRPYRQKNLARDALLMEQRTGQTHQIGRPGDPPPTFTRPAEEYPQYQKSSGDERDEREEREEKESMYEGLPRFDSPRSDIFVSTLQNQSQGSVDTAGTAQSTPRKRPRTKLGSRPMMDLLNKQMKR